MPVNHSIWRIGREDLGVEVKYSRKWGAVVSVIRVR